jgi:rubredoxin
MACRAVRQDHYLSLFFVPLIPVKRGEAFWQCRSCGQAFPDRQGQPGQGEPGGRPGRALRPPGRCPGCGRRVEPEFSYCPYCGRRL